MNREELVEIMMEHIGETEGVVTMKRVLADRILAALAKEREGEVVLENMKGVYIAPSGKWGYKSKEGQLIFREDKGEKI